VWDGFAVNAGWIVKMRCPYKHNVGAAIEPPVVWTNVFIGEIVKMRCPYKHNVGAASCRPLPAQTLSSEELKNALPILRT
jgi:hypothetical protein